MPAGEEAVDRANARRGLDGELGEAATCLHLARPRGRRLQGSHRGRPDGDHAAAGRAGGGHLDCRLVGHRPGLGVRRLAVLQGGEAGVEQDLCEGHAAQAQVAQDARRERSRGARHLCAPRLAGEDGLEGIERHVPGRVAVAHRPSVAAKDLVHGCLEVEVGQPEAGARDGAVERERRHEPCRAGRQRDGVAGGRVVPARPGRMAQLDDPRAAGQPRGQVEVERAMARVEAGQRGRHRGRGVDHEQVARGERAGQVAEPAVRQLATLGHEQPHVVARAALRLGRDVGLELVGQLEVERSKRAHAAAAATARAS